MEDGSLMIHISSKIDFHKKALKLQNKVPIPQLLYYKYDNLATKARTAQAKINEYNSTLDDAIDKIHNGSEKVS